MSRPDSAVKRPVLRHILNLWTLVGCPSKAKEWSLKRKMEAVKEAGFHGIMDHLTPEHKRHAEKLGLMTLGFFRSGKADELAALLRQQKQAGAVHINVHLGEHDTPTPVAVRLAEKLITEGRKLGVQPSIEVHRDTCTETPEKTYALADAYEEFAGERVPFTWDYSHIAVVKHLLPPFWDRLGVRPDLIQQAQQFHFRPFNGHHCQVPVTDGRGRFTPEFLDYLPLVEKVMQTWLAAASPGRELFAVPELGPLWLGYGLHSFPNSWDDAQVLREELEKCWRNALQNWRPPPSVDGSPARASNRRNRFTKVHRIPIQT